MVLAKDSDGNFQPVAAGEGVFKCTKAYYESHKDDIPNNTLIIITDDDGVYEPGLSITNYQKQSVSITLNDIGEGQHHFVWDTPFPDNDYIVIASGNGFEHCKIEVSQPRARTYCDIFLRAGYAGTTGTLMAQAFKIG